MAILVSSPPLLVLTLSVFVCVDSEVLLLDFDDISVSWSGSSHACLCKFNGKWCKTPFLANIDKNESLTISTFLSNNNGMPLRSGFDISDIVSRNNVYNAAWDNVFESINFSNFNFIPLNAA